MSAVSPCPAPGCKGPDGNPVLTTDRICTDCRARVARVVDGLLRMYVQLGIELCHLPTADGPVGTVVESRPPLRTDVLDLMDTMREAAQSWCRMVSPYWQRRRVASRGAVMTDAVKYLHRNHEKILVSERAAEFVTELLTLDRRGRRVLGWNRLVHHLPVPCPYCNLLALVRVDGDDRVFCGVCAVAWNHDDYQRLVTILAWEHGHARAG